MESDLEKPVGADTALDLETYLGVKHTIRQGLYIEKHTFLRPGLEKTVTDDMVLDLQIKQGLKNTL